MPRKYIRKGIHTSPENAGPQNMPDNLPKDDMGILAGLMPIWDKGVENTFRYKGLWTDEQLAESVSEYFNYCAINNVKTAKVGLQLWLGLSRTQYYDWETKPEKFGAKTNIIGRANQIIEMAYIGRAEKYPTANIFLLKAGHQYVEQNKLDITTNGKQIGSPEELTDAISKLGLDKED